MVPILIHEPGAVIGLLDYLMDTPPKYVSNSKEDGLL